MRVTWSLLFAVVAFVHPQPAQATPAAVELPKTVTLTDALRVFHQRGFDLLLADANVLSSEGDLGMAGAIPNPSVSAIYGRVIDKSYGATSANAYSVGVSDNGALFDSLSNKRGLRLAVARDALRATKLLRKDAERTLDLQLKQAWIAVVAADATLRFATEVQKAAERTLEVNRARFPGKIDEGTLARIETEKLETDRQVATAKSALKLTKVGLAFLLGVRDAVPAFDVPSDALGFVVPGKLVAASEVSLKQAAFDHRPDWLASKAFVERADDTLALANRMKFPDLQLFASYSQTGTGPNAVQPPTISFGLTVTLPSFYRYEGEIKKAKAEQASSGVTRQKLEAQIAADVVSAFETFGTERLLVERMEAELLPRSKKARDITESQFEEGKAPLTDYLDAQRRFIASNVEHLQDLESYWSAVYQLEQAVGMELRS